MLESISSQAAYDVRRRYYKMLRDITGFSLDKKKKPDPEDLMRVYLGEASNEDKRLVCNALDEENIPYDTDGAGRLLIERQYMKEASKVFDKEGINADVVSA